MSRMPMRLGKVQFEIMQVLWEHGRATAREITEELSRTRPIAHSTVQTLLRQLEVKGAVSHELEDRAFVFVPQCQESEVTDSVTHDLLTRMFGGSVYGLVAHLLEHEKVSHEEIERLRELINQEKET